MGFINLLLNDNIKLAFTVRRASPSTLAHELAKHLLTTTPDKVIYDAICPTDFIQDIMIKLHYGQLRVVVRNIRQTRSMERTRLYIEFDHKLMSNKLLETNYRLRNRDLITNVCSYDLMYKELKKVIKYLKKL